MAHLRVCGVDAVVSCGIVYKHLPLECHYRYTISPIKSSKWRIFTKNNYYQFYNGLLEHVY